jgi:hypothetical protein
MHSTLINLAKEYHDFSFIYNNLLKNTKLWQNAKKLHWLCRAGYQLEITIIELHYKHRKRKVSENVTHQCCQQCKGLHTSKILLWHISHSKPISSQQIFIQRIPIVLRATAVGAATVLLLKHQQDPFGDPCLLASVIRHQPKIFLDEDFY